MARLCERPTCGASAAFAYGFDVERRIVWLDALGDERFRAGALCRRHADRLTVPRGWWLEDRRTPDSLFEVDEPGAEGGAEAEPAPVPKARARRKKAAAVAVEPEGEPAPGVIDVPAPQVSDPAAPDPPHGDLLGEDPGPFPDPTAVDVAEPFEDPDPGEPEHQWEPAFASVDPDPAVDAASTPLLAKAFGHDAPQPGPRRRPRRPRASAGPPAAGPPAVEPAAVDPAPGAPPAVDPAPGAPPAVDPAPGAPLAVDPAPADPPAADPAPADPIVAEPSAADPGDPPAAGPVG